MNYKIQVGAPGFRWDIRERFISVEEATAKAEGWIKEYFMLDMSKTPYRIVNEDEPCDFPDHWTPSPKAESDYPKVIRELMLAVEYLRVCCEHAEGRRVRDREALSKGMSLGIMVNWKYKNQIPDYQRETFWADYNALHIKTTRQ